MNFFYKIYDALCVDIFEYILGGRGYALHRPCRPRGGVLTLTDPRGGHFFDNWPTGTLLAGRQADVVFTHATARLFPVFMACWKTHRFWYEFSSFLGLCSSGTIDLLLSCSASPPDQRTSYHSNDALQTCPDKRPLRMHKTHHAK